MASKQELQVLVVDRDEATKVELKDFLAAEGHHAYSVADPEQVIGVVKQGRGQMGMLAEPRTKSPAKPASGKVRNSPTWGSRLTITSWLQVRPTRKATSIDTLSNFAPAVAPR